MAGKVLITGGFGNLGSWVTKYLLNLDYEIYILTRKEKNTFLNIRYNVIECDIVNIEELEKKLNFNIDYCIHMASYNEFYQENYYKKALEVNTLGTRNLVSVLSKKDIKNFIYFSTFHVYGTSEGIINESSTLNPKNDYASTHLFAEYYIRQFGFTNNLKYTILRLTNSYGCPNFSDTNKWYLVLNDLVKSAYTNKKIILKSNGKIKRDFIWMGDVSVIVLKLLKNDSTNDIYNLSSNISYEMLDIANKVKLIYKKKYGKNIPIVVNEKDKSPSSYLTVENKKLKSFIDYEVSEKLTSEIEKIFKLLEENNE